MLWWSAISQPCSKLHGTRGLVRRLASLLLNLGRNGSSKSSYNLSSGLVICKALRLSLKQTRSKASHVFSTCSPARTEHVLFPNVLSQTTQHIHAHTHTCLHLCKSCFNYTVQSLRALYTLCKRPESHGATVRTLTCHVLSRLAKTCQDQMIRGVIESSVLAAPMLSAHHPAKTHPDILEFLGRWRPKERAENNMPPEPILCYIISHSQIETCLLLTSVRVCYCLLLCTVHKCTLFL